MRFTFISMATYSVWSILTLVTLSTFLSQFARGQNNIVQRIWREPDSARVTFTDLSSGSQHMQKLDSLTLDASFNLPSGTYQRKIEVPGNYLFQDTVGVSKDSTLQDDMIKNIPSGSDYYNSFLELIKDMTRTDPEAPNEHKCSTWKFSNRPLKVFMHDYDSTDAYSRPKNWSRSNLETAMQDITTKTNWQFTESDSGSTIQVQVDYVPQSEIPVGGVAYTTISRNPDLTPRKARIRINRQLSKDIATAVYIREFERLLGLFDSFKDPSFILYYFGTGSPLLTNSEANIMKTMQGFHKNIVDMDAYTDSVVGPLTGVVELDKPLPQNFNLLPNYPNPFNGSTKIQYELKEASTVQLTVYDMQGRLVQTLVNQRQGPGTYETPFESDNIASGAYFYILKTNGNLSTRRMLFVK